MIERIAIIGTGRIAQAIARTWPKQIAAVWGRRFSEAEQIAGSCRGRALPNLEDIWTLGFELVWVATSDSFLAEAAQRLSDISLDWSGKTVIHSSGILSEEVLRPLECKGAHILALHPNAAITGLTAFPGGIVWGVGEKSDQQCTRALLSGLNPFLVRIADAQRPLYHAAASLASNATVLIFALALELYEKAGISSEIASNMVHSFMIGGVEDSLEFGPQRAITGPVVRGDTDTVKRQLAAIEREVPGLADFYRSFLLQSAETFGNAELWKKELTVAGER